MTNILSFSLIERLIAIAILAFGVPTAASMTYTVINSDTTEFYFDVICAITLVRVLWVLIIRDLL
jgi:hypothetical protein